METVPFPVPFSGVIGNNLAKGPFHEFDHILIFHTAGLEDLDIARIVIEDFGNIHFLADLVNVELWYT